ncbi:hypothetical protein [Rahnella laticis]|uniref:hypothetical protein n=1 Tax=Rahnella laticis TaxID=2787622 RepID=UPI0018A26858|nr:hypothetical protein [Rahnella laticis]MBF7996627.1 hypothetical protein [Rahnella laticis]
MMKKITSAFVIFMLTAFQGAWADNLQLLDMLQQEHLIPSSEKPVVQEEIKTSTALTGQSKHIEAPKVAIKASSTAKTLPKKAKAKHKKSDDRAHAVINVQPKTVQPVRNAGAVVVGQELPKSDFEAPPSGSTLPEPVKAAVVPTAPVATPATMKVEPKPATEVAQKAHQSKKKHKKVRKSGKKKRAVKKEQPAAESVVKVQEVKAAEQPSVVTTAEVKNAVQN